MRIVGVSFGEPAATAAWVQQERFGFEVWTDVDRTLATTYGAARPLLPYPKRVTMVLDPDGNLVLEYVDHVDAGAHPAEVLADLKRMAGHNDVPK